MRHILSFLPSRKNNILGPLLLCHILVLHCWREGPKLAKSGYKPTSGPVPPPKKTQRIQENKCNFVHSSIVPAYPIFLPVYPRIFIFLPVYPRISIFPPVYPIGNNIHIYTSVSNNMHVSTSESRNIHICTSVSKNSIFLPVYPGISRSDLLANKN